MGAVFLAEMLSPLAANPVYWTAPVFVGRAYGLVYGPGLGLLAAVVVGVPLTLAAGCMGKAAGDWHNAACGAATARADDWRDELARLCVHDAAVSGDVCGAEAFWDGNALADAAGGDSVAVVGIVPGTEAGW
jgi:hypothetical protein